MKRVARHRHDEPIVGIPRVVGVAVVRVQPPLVVVVIDVEDVQIAVRIGAV